VHWGATTQDIMDTAALLQLRAGFEPIARDIAQLRKILADLSKRHRDTPMAVAPISSRHRLRPSATRPRSGSRCSKITLALLPPWSAGC